MKELWPDRGSPLMISATVWKTSGDGRKKRNPALDLSHI